jgi:hypothetical protein
VKANGGEKLLGNEDVLGVELPECPQEHYVGKRGHEKGGIFAWKDQGNGTSDRVTSRAVEKVRMELDGNHNVGRGPGLSSLTVQKNEANTLSFF